MDPARQKRKEEIKKALKFIQSSLAYPEPEGYQDFLTQLVCNLLDEGNASFRDKEWEQAAREFSEGLNVSSYAAGEDIQIPEVLLESLYVNRAAAYHSLGEHEQGVRDCNRALDLCKESHRALYRKALCLKELGRYKEAYNCTTDCLLISRLDQQVNELAQELAVHLGLKNRKPYISAKEDVFIRRGATNGNVTSEATARSSPSPPTSTAQVSADAVGNRLNPLSSPRVTFASTAQSTVTPTLSSSHQPAGSLAPDRVDALDDFELMGDDLDSLLDCFPAEPQPAEAASSAPSRMSTHSVPSVLPAPTPQLPPAFFTSSVSQLNSLDSFSAGGHGTTLDTLDDLLTSPGLDALDNFSPGIRAEAGAPDLGPTSAVMDSLDDLDCLDDLLDTPTSAATDRVNKPRTEMGAEEKSLDDLLDELDPVHSVPVRLGGDVLKVGVKAVDKLDSLDALDSFPSARAALPAASTGRAGSAGYHRAAAPLIRSQNKERNNQVPVAAPNPLSSTHDFLQACSACFPREGLGIYTYVHKPELLHTCKRDILLCRRKVDYPSEWTRVRAMPPNMAFKGPFVLCKELLISGDLGLCKYGEKCTFAYNQLEIDVWTEERKGTLSRNLLFESDPGNSIVHLLQEHKGSFVFLCQECFDNDPTIISERCRDDQTVCSNSHTRHIFDANKCLVFLVSAHEVTYKKVRLLRVVCRFELCRQNIRYGCPRGDNCLSAHSCIELKTWRVQQHTGISHEEIVKVSTKYYNNLGQSSNKQRGNRLPPGGGGNKPRGGGGGGGRVEGGTAAAGKSLNMKMKFACAQCWQDGQIIEPDKTLKFCTAKARHKWTKDRRVLLVKSLERGKWVQVRPLPQTKNPLQYDMCPQMSEKRKCAYHGSCTFAHCQEEREMWTYMRTNKLIGMQMMYDLWLASLNHKRQGDEAPPSQPAPEDKYIAMPTDYAEVISDFYCRLCGKHSNSERQWQQHISTEKHKDRVFSCEGEEEALMWSYRFPGRCFKLCPKLDGVCPEGVSCDFAHSVEELQEWTDRRDFLRQKLAKAREDMLIMPDQSDFGKYNFLLQD